MNVYPIFSTPLLVGSFPHHVKHKKRFKNFNKVDRRPSTWTQPLNTSFPNVTSDDPFVSNDDIMALKSDILIYLKSVMRKYNMPEDVFYADFWYNAYYNGDGQEMHDHLSEVNHNPFWSGIYFCRNCHTGSLTLTRRDQSNRLQQACNWNNTDPQLAQHYEPTVDPQIDDGTIILFPPHVYHQVKYNSDQMRLTFSFNIYREPLKAQLSDGTTIKI